MPCSTTQRGLNGVTRIATMGDFPVETSVKMRARSVLQPYMRLNSLEESCRIALRLLITVYPYMV